MTPEGAGLTNIFNCCKILPVKLNRKQRNSLAIVLYDLAKYTFAGLVLAQIVAAEKFKVWIFVLGLGAVVLFILIGLVVEGGNAEK